MKLIVAGFAFVLLCLAGCGSTSSGRAASAARTSAMRAAGISQEQEELERSQGVATTPAEERENEARQKVTQEADEHEERETEQQEAKEEARRENAPGSHHYPPAIRSAFVHECEKTSGHEDSACKCAIKGIEAKVPLSRFKQNGQEVGAGKPLSFVYAFEIGYCATSAAASG